MILSSVSHLCDGFEIVFTLIQNYFSHFSAPDDILCYVAELPNVTIEKCIESNENKANETTEAEKSPTTTEKANRRDAENANATTSQVDQSSSVNRGFVINAPSMEVDDLPVSNDFSNQGNICAGILLE